MFCFKYLKRVSFLNGRRLTLSNANEKCVMKLAIKILLKAAVKWVLY